MNTGRVVTGIGFVSLGTVLLLDRGGVLDAGEVVADWWPVMFLVAAVVNVLSRPPRPIGAAVLAAIGLVLLGVTTDLVSGSVLALVWPIGILALGLWLLWRRGSLADASVDGDAIDVTVLFSGRKIVSTSRRFRGGDATAIFGGIELDLTGAHIDGTADLELVALFGGVEVTVPYGWRVLMDGPAILGGHESNVPAPVESDAPTLRVRATAILGGVEVGVGEGWPAPRSPDSATV